MIDQNYPVDNMCSSDQADTRTLGPGPGHGTKTLDSMSVVKKSAKLRVSGGSKDWGISELVDLSGNGRNETRNDRVDHYHADTVTDTAVRATSHLQVRQHKNFMKLQKSKSFENELQKVYPLVWKLHKK